MCTVESYIKTKFFHVLKQDFTHILVEETEELRPDYKSDLDTKCLEDLSEFNTDVSTTDYSHGFRELGHLEEVVTVHAVF